MGFQESRHHRMEHAKSIHGLVINGLVALSGRHQHRTQSIVLDEIGMSAPLLETKAMLSVDTLDQLRPVVLGPRANLHLDQAIIALDDQMISPIPRNWLWIRHVVIGPYDVPSRLPTQVLDQGPQLALVCENDTAAADVLHLRQAQRRLTRELVADGERTLETLADDCNTRVGVLLGVVAKICRHSVQGLRVELSEAADRLPMRQDLPRVELIVDERANRRASLVYSAVGEGSHGLTLARQVS